MLRTKNTMRFLVATVVIAILAGTSHFALAIVTDKTPTGGQHTVASSRSIDRAVIRKISTRIDELVNAKLKEDGLKRNPMVTDEIFLRRIYLDVIGRIPTLEETNHFFDSKSKTKRADLIDQLLDSYGFVSHQFNYWADVLRVQSRINKVIGQPYIDFIKDSLQSNMPYDQFVVELLSAEGRMMANESNAVGYYLRDLNMPEDNMSNTVRIFLGTRLECAQCHDHPFDKWTQRDYFEMVAFTGGINYGQGNLIGQLTPAERKQVQQLRKESAEQFGRIRRFLSMSQLGVFGTGTGLARLPEGFMGDDGEENEIVVGKTMFEKDSLVESRVPKMQQARFRSRKKKKKNKQPRLIQGATEIGSRTAYARWLASAENERFATTIANRLWKQAFGLALIEPVDVIEDNTEASNQPLMDFLTEAIVDLKFDRKQFLRSIYNSRTYQSVATAADISEPETHAFNGPIVRRMSAEQIWDSLLTLTVPDTDRRTSVSPYPRLKEIEELVTAIANDEEEALGDLIAYARRNFNGKQKSNEKKKGKRQDDAMQDKEEDPYRQQARKARDTMKTLNRQIKQAQRSRDADRVKSLLLKRAEMMQALKSNQVGVRYKRASELPSPAPAGHFLRQFGQSDRDQIENSNRDPAVPQVLAMMNGMIENQIVKDPNTVLMSNLLKMPGVQVKSSGGNELDAINTIFLTMLNREPAGKEKQQWRRDFRTDFRAAYGDLIWTLANSNEFIFLK